MVSFVAHFGPVSVNFDRSLTVAEKKQLIRGKKACQRGGAYLQNQSKPIIEFEGCDWFIF